MNYKIVGRVITKENEDGHECPVTLSINPGDEQGFAIYTDEKDGDISLYLDIEDVKRILKEEESEEEL